jgi:hypothetical protein
MATRVSHQTSRERSRGGSRASVRAARLAGAIVVLASLLAGCATTDGPVATFPPVSVGPDRTVTPAVNLTRSTLVTALAPDGLALTDAQVPFRPPESQRLTDAPRAVYQVVLPNAPDAGFIVVYELADPDHANQAANEQAQYLASGPGRVQSSLESVDVIRVVGNTVVLYSWIPGAARDPKEPSIQGALETVGLGVDVPS